MMSASQDKIKFKFEMMGQTMIEEAIVEKIEGNKIYCKTLSNIKLIFNKDTKYCYTDNNTFGAKRTLL